MSNVTPEFLEQYNYTLNLLNKAAEENRLGWLELREMHRKSKEENERYWAEYKEEQRIRNIEYNQIKRRMGEQEDQYGKFAESFVRHQFVRVLREWDIQVDRVSPRTEMTYPDGSTREFDVIAENCDVYVFCEVKSTLQNKGIERFVEKMKQLREASPKKYEGKKIIAAVAYIHDAVGAVETAQNMGLLTILATASSAKITNAAGFQPTEF